MSITVGVALVIIVAFAEELIFRGLLLSRFAAAGLRPWMASLLAGELFVLGHGYEGGAALAAIVAFTVVMTRLVRWRHSLTSAIVAHALYDLAVVVVLPALAAGR